MGGDVAYVLVPLPRSDAVVLSEGKITVRPVSLGLRGGENASSRPSFDSTFGLEALFAAIPVLS